MSTAELVRDGQPVFGVGTDDADFMCVSQQFGRLRIGGTLLQSSIQTGKLQKLVIKASQAVAAISFQGIDVPIEIETAHHGTLHVKPNPKTTILPLFAPPDVLAALNLAEGFVAATTVNIEAILGFLNELRVEEGRLLSANGNRVLPTACAALLGQLGVATAVKGDVHVCLKLCAQLGVTSSHNVGLIAGVLQRAGGSEKRLRHSIEVMEECGYRIRLRRRVSSVCNPLPTEADGPPRPWLRIVPIDHSIELALAA